MTDQMTIDQAHEIVAEQRRLEREKNREQQKRAYVGKFFKYHNRFSDGDNWWLYATVTEVNEWGHAYGWSFEHKSNDEIDVQRRALLNTIGSGGWTEITADEFWSGAATVLAVVHAQLEPPVKPS